MTEIALIGKKLGMTREFYKSGQLVPVTVIKMQKARVIQVIEEDKRGYKAIQLGYGKIKSSKLTHFWSLIMMVSTIFLNSPYFWRKSHIKLISESQFQRGLILRASGFAGVSFVADGISHGFGGFSHVL